MERRCRRATRQMVQVACAEFGYGMIVGVSPDALYGIEPRVHRRADTPTRRHCTEPRCARAERGAMGLRAKKHDRSEQEGSQGAIRFCSHDCVMRLLSSVDF